MIIFVLYLFVGTVHASKGCEADSVYLGQPELIPLQERVQLGGWEGREERMLEYVATSRARRRLVRLPHVDNLTREAIHEMFEPPRDVHSTQHTQETEPFPSQPSDGGGSQETFDADDDRLV